MANKDVSVEDEDKFEQWLDDQLTGRYATGNLETDLRMAVSTIRGMSKMTPKDFAVQPLMRFIAAKEHEAELRGREQVFENLIKRIQSGAIEMVSVNLDQLKAELTAPTTNDTATDGGE